MTSLIECADCGHQTFYKKRRCPACGSDSFEKREPGVGELLAVTTNHVTPDGVRKRNRLGFAMFGETTIIAQLEAGLESGDEVRLEDGYELRQTDAGAIVDGRLVHAD